jgi:hypothetical protein
MKKSLDYNWTDYRTNTEILNEIKIPSFLEKNKCISYKSKWANHVNRMVHNKLPRI